MSRTPLSVKIVRVMDAYLRGDRTPKDVAVWAASTLGAVVLDSSEVLLDEALSELAALGHDDPALDTPREDIEHLRDCLLGKATHTVELRYTRAP